MNRIIRIAFKTLVKVQYPFEYDMRGVLMWDPDTERLVLGADSDWRPIPLKGEPIATRGNTPIATTLTAAGTTAAVTLETYSTDMAGRVELTTGGTGITSGGAINVAFDYALGDTNFTVLLTCGTSQAAAKHWHTSNRTVNGFDIACADVMTTAEVYGFHYLVIPRFT